MKQRLLKGIMCLTAVCLFAALCCGQVLAAASAQPVRVFVYENTLYTYVRLDGIDQPVTQVEAKIGSQSFGASTRFWWIIPLLCLHFADNWRSFAVSW